MSTGGQYFPFGQVPSLSQPPVTYDIVMAKNFPRVSFVPTEPGGIYQELVEVNGDLWCVTNATWDVNKLGFYQSSGTLTNCNPNQNAYAWVQRGLTGDAIRMYGAMTGNANVAVTWVPIFDAAPKGTVISPLPLTQAGQAALTVNATFNATTSTAVTAFAINVQNVASSQNSVLEQFTVNGVPVWLVDINGILQIGQINPSQLNPPVYMSLTAGVGIAPISPPPNAKIGLSHDDYVDIPNDQSITGVKTIPSTTRIMLGDGDGNIGGGPDDGVYLASGAEILNFPIVQAPPNSATAIAKSATAMILAGKQETPNNQMLTLYVNTGLTIGNTYTPTPVAWFDNAGNFTVTEDLIVQGSLSVTGGTTFTGHVTINGTLTLNGNLVLSSTTVLALMGYFEGSQDPAFNHNPENGGKAGLILGYNAGDNAIVWDTSSLAYIGVGTGTGGSGLTSHDSSVKITKAMGTTQNVDFSVAAAVANAFPVYDEGSATAVSNPLIIKGNTPFNTVANGLGPGAGSATAPDVAVNFPGGLTFPNSYSIGLSVHGDWFTVNIKTKTAGGFTMSVGLIANNLAASGNVYWVCVGN